MRGRKPKFTEAEQNEMLHLYRNTKMNLTQIARMFRCTQPTATKYIDAAAKRKNAPTNEKEMTMNAKHTAGPWQISSIRHEADGCYTYALGKDSEVAAANCQLIASAPYMLSALRRCLAHFETIRPEGSPDSDLMAHVRAAIAKATGEQS